MRKILSYLCKHRIERIHYNYLCGRITSEQASDKRFFWRTIYAKWVYGECHHLCCLCDYKYECWSNAKEK